MSTNRNKTKPKASGKPINNNNQTSSNGSQVPSQPGNGMIQSQQKPVTRQSNA